MARKSIGSAKAARKHRGGEMGDRKQGLEPVRFKPGL